MFKQSDEWADAHARIMTREELARAKDDLAEIGGLIGYVPAEVAAILHEVLERRDHAAAIVATRLAELAR